MNEVPVPALDSHLQKLVESARAALERNDAAKTARLCRAVLETAPGCLPVRKLWRDAQLKTVQASGFVAKACAAFTSLMFVVAGDRQVKRDPLRALRLAERALAADPDNRFALGLLGRSAAALGWRETAVFAYEILRQLEPRDADHLVALGRAQLDAGRAVEAIECAVEALRLNPLHGPAQALQRDASVAESLRQGNWEEQGDFRRKLRS
jgi:tetratricopeptide (TPR) repeat protein